MDVNEFREFGRAAIDFLADYFENIRERLEENCPMTESDIVIVKTIKVNVLIFGKYFYNHQTRFAIR
jgi:hypothetical protein